MSETFSFLRLRELIDAKIARRLSLVAEVSALDAELAEGHQLLNSIPSLRAAARRDIRGTKALACQRCKKEFRGRSEAKFCQACFPIIARERVTKMNRSRMALRPPALVKDTA